MSIIPLSTADSIHNLFTIQNIVPAYDHDVIAQRLKELGFLPGVCLRLIACTPFNMGPIVVKISCTRFALRYSEAHRILVKPLTYDSIS